MARKVIVRKVDGSKEEFDANPKTTTRGSPKDVRADIVEGTGEVVVTITEGDGSTKRRIFESGQVRQVDESR